MKRVKLLSNILLIAALLFSANAGILFARELGPDVVPISIQAAGVFLSESFDATTMPSGWAVIDNAGNGAVWRFDNPSAYNNCTGGSGNFAVADSDYAGEVDVDTELHTPAMDFSGVSSNVQLTFKVCVEFYESEIADVDVSTNGGTDWTNVWRRTGQDFNGAVAVDLSTQVAGQSNVLVRFRYYNANYEYAWEVDDVQIATGSSYKVYLPLMLRSYPAPVATGFLPNPDGYSFSNYGNSHYYEDDLGVADLIHMFGAATVCASGSTPADCVLTSAADAWRQQIIASMGGGHCEGMAVTSLRFFKGQAYYTGDTTPGDFQSGVQKVYDLALDQAIQNYIAYYFATQDVEEIWYPTGLIRTNNTPKQILELVKQGLPDSSDPYSLGIYQYDNGNLTMGHAITPYSVVDKGGGVQWLYVYDNNFPGDTNRYIVFDTTSDTWQYNTAANHEDPPELYQGNASTFSLDLTRTSYRNQEPFTCPFSTAATKIEFFLTNGGDMLITNTRGQRIGYDVAAGQMLNEIPDAQVVYLKGVSSPMYVLPLQEADKLYDVTVSGQTLAEAVDTNLVMVGPGYVVGFEHIQLEPDQDLLMSISSDGTQLTFKEGQTAPAPQAFIANDSIEP